MQSSGRASRKDVESIHVYLFEEPMALVGSAAGTRPFGAQFEDDKLRPPRF